MYQLLEKNNRTGAIYWINKLKKGDARVGKRLYDEVPIEANGRTERESSSLVVYDMAIL